MIRRHFLTGAAAAALAACASDPVTRDTFYRFGDAAPQAALAGGPIMGTLEVPPLRAEGVVNERAILFRDGPRSLAQYSYHSWTEPPAAMVQHAFIAMLRQTQAFTTVASPDMRLDRDYELLGKVIRLEHVVGGGAATAAVEVELSLRRVRDNQQLLAKTYRGDEPAAADNVDAAVAGFTKALDSIFAAFLRDVAALPKASPPPAASSATP